MPTKWQTIEDLRPHLDPIVTDVGRMPNHRELGERGRSDLRNAIKKFGGMRTVAETLGYEYFGPRSWESVSDLRPHLDPLVEELGHMPSQRQLRARGRDDLVAAIHKFGSPADVAAILGYPYTPRNSWTSLEALRVQLDPLVDELGRLPSESELRARGRADLASAMRKFGGKSAVAEQLQYSYEPPQSWSSIDDLRPHLDPIVTEIGYMPGKGELIRRDRQDLVSAIRKFGGVSAVADALNYPYVGKKPKPKVTSIEDLRPLLDPLVTELGRMPIGTELAARGRYDIAQAVSQLGGSFDVAKALEYPYEGYKSWRSVEDLRLELAPIVGELGRMPKEPELVAMGRHDINSAIRKFGGSRAVAESLGYVYAGYKSWTTVEDLRPYLEPIVGALGRMPTMPELDARGMTDVRGAVERHHGPARVAELLGYPYPFTSAAERRSRFHNIEAAVVELQQSQVLSAGQVMLILRHAGLLTRGHLLETLHRLQVDVETTNGGRDEPSIVPTSFGDEFPDGEVANVPRTTGTDGSHDQTSSAADSGSSIIEVQIEVQAEDHYRPSREKGPEPNRDRRAEVKELRGWSHLGNLLDPTPALIQLSVTRLKTAFYHFADEVRGSLEAPVTPPAPEQLEHTKAELWGAAFGEYGDLLDNDLVREACDTYISDLAGALLLPRHETEYVPRLYQLDGARFVAERVSSDDFPYGLLFDQPGMGKTLTTLWGLAAGGVERIVVVASLTVKQQVWTLETIHQAFPHLDAECFAANLDAALALPDEGPAVAVLHYEELRRLEDINRLAASREDDSLPFDVLVLDEAHEVKERLSTGSSRGPTRTGAWILRQAARACIGLTATPVVNELYEPVSLLHLAQGKRTTDAGRRLQSRRLRDRVDVMEYLLADSLRRLKPDVLYEIPPREIRTRELVPDAELLDRMRVFLSRGRRAVAAQLAEYRRLVLEGKLDWIQGAVKANLNVTTPEGLPDPKTLVLCYNVEGVSKAIYERLVSDLGAERVLHIDGSTPQLEREELLRQFRAPADAEHGAAVLVGTVGTVGVGVTLFDPQTPVTPHRVIFADLPFTWAEFEQGVDRLHRVGQKLPVQIDVPVVTFAEQLTRADGESLESFDQWVWGWIKRKQLLSDQVLDAAFDVSEYKDSAVRKAISQALRAVEESGGAVIAPPPPEESPAAEHRRSVGRLRGVPRERAAQTFREARASERFLAANDASRSARLAQRLVRERLSRWLDRRSVVIDLGCGSNPLRDLSCERVVGIDRHGVNGGLVGDSADTGLPGGEADFVVMSLSMWGTPEDRPAYLREAKRLLRPLGKLVVVEPISTFGGPDAWQSGSTRFGTVVDRLGMSLAEARAYAVDAGTTLVALVVDNSTTAAAHNVDPDECVWND